MQPMTWERFEHELVEMRKEVGPDYHQDGCDMFDRSGHPCIWARFCERVSGISANDGMVFGNWVNQVYYNEQLFPMEIRNRFRDMIYRNNNLDRWHDIIDTELARRGIEVDESQPEPELELVPCK